MPNNNYFVAGRHQLECVKINSLGIRKKIGSLERHVVQLRIDDYVAPVEKPPKKQTSILSLLEIATSTITQLGIYPEN